MKADKELVLGDILHRSKFIKKTLIHWVEKNLERHHIDLFYGVASFLDKQTIRIVQRNGTEAQLSADKFLIATGAKPIRPAHFPYDAPNVFDSDSLSKMGKLPTSIIIVGAGTIGCEYACIFQTLGIQVTLISGSNQIFPFADKEIVAGLIAYMRKLGIQLLLSHKVKTVQSNTKKVEVLLNSRDKYKAEAIFIATGRRSNIDGLGLQKVGVILSSEGTICVNHRFQTSQENIYAAGDVIGAPGLCSTAMEQGRMAMIHAFDLKYKSSLSAYLPFGIWTIPEISMVGETEESLQEKGIPYVVGKANYRDVPRGMTIGEENGFLKLLFSTIDTTLLGVHIIGEQACELIAPGLVAINQGANFQTFIDTSFNFPSLSDLYKYATYDAMDKKRRLFLKLQNDAI